MPLRYLSLTLIVTERKAHCFFNALLSCLLLNVSALLSLWMAVGIWLPFSVCSAVTWCAHVQNTQKLQSLPLGNWDAGKICSHYLLSDVLIFWGSWFLRVQEDSGWTEGPWAECSGPWVCKRPRAVHLYADGTSLPKSDCDLLLLACLSFLLLLPFFFF